MFYSRTKPAENILPWKTADYDMWFHNPCLLVHNMLSNPDFAAKIEYVLYWDHADGNKCCYKYFLAGNLAWKQADPETHRSTFVPLIIGSDKTTISVATGHTKYHLLYLSIGNIFNRVQHTHCNGVVLVGFLATPKNTKEHLDDKDFCNFYHQIFHSLLAKIFELVKLNMMVSNVVCCPDSHYWYIIHELGPYITNYPEQHEYGIIQEIVPFTNDFLQADIHDLLSPDILHQIIRHIQRSPC
ncbi:hypothetical protein BDR04DRAFT_1115820 [Suillus decipiens]|nr:hypothetical protein BDR04DRAFT_1115820 [Suillus decipiens]